VQGQDDVPPLIPLSPGHGVNISFLSTGEAIEKVWLDDPSWVVVGVDGCLAGLSAEDCAASSSSNVLHLRRIESLAIQGIPPAKSSLLTVITRNPRSAERRIHVFRLVKGREVPTFHTVEVVLPNRGEVTSADVSALKRGRKEAIQQGWLEESGPLDHRILSFLTSLASQGAEEAARTAGISLALVSRLEELGARHSF
jgi:hypothetical protein